MASYLYETPVAFITLLEQDLQEFKVCRGFDVKQMPRETSFCTHTILHESTLVVTDANTDPRFSDNPLVAHTTNIRFYAGAPLSTHDGQKVGTLCVMDTNPKEVSEEKKQLMYILANQVINIMELGVSYKLINEKVAEVEVRNKVLMDIAFIQSHEFRAPLANIMGIMNLIKEDGYVAPENYLLMMEDAVGKLDEKIRVVVKSTELAKQTFTA